ncbi:MAG: DUF1801 domain-containing protein [Chloroflexota bacterium]
MSDPKPAAIDDYLAALPEDQRAPLEQIRAIVREEAPDAVEVISYGMPGWRIGGRLAVSAAAFKAHSSLFPASGAVMAELAEELAPYFEPKATLRFRLDAPLPADLVRRVVRIRTREIREGGR